MIRGVVSAVRPLAREAPGESGRGKLLVVDDNVVSRDLWRAISSGRATRCRWQRMAGAPWR